MYCTFIVPSPAESEFLSNITNSQRNIFPTFQLSEKTDPRSVDAVTRRKLQALGRHSNYTCVDKIFGGQLVSTIVCEQCHNSSQVKTHCHITLYGVVHLLSELGCINYDLGCSPIQLGQEVATVASHKSGEFLKSRSGTTAYQDRNNLAKISKSEMLRDIKK